MVCKPRYIPFSHFFGAVSLFFRQDRLRAGSAEENSGKMELTREQFMGLSPEDVHAFVLEKNFLDKEDADKLVKNKVKGSTLMESSAQEVKDLYGLPGGPANELVKNLKRIFPGEGKI